jgi:iron complex outermembrane receptor protein
MTHHYTGPLLITTVLGCACLFQPCGSLGVPLPDSHPDDGAIEEILVTARRRDEASVAVPMALTRIDGATLDGLQYYELDQILSLSPGVLVYTGGDGVSSQITIRGAVTPGAMVEPGNAVYVDDVYASGMRTILPGFYDIESVQVLKGPQAGLYGRNTTGGAVVITTAKPGDEWFTRIDTSYAQYDSRQASGTVNLPFSDSLRLRATGWYEDSNGGYYQSKVADQHLDASHQIGGRLALALLPNDRTGLTLTGEYVDINEGGFPFGDGLVEGAPLGPASLGPESRRNVLRDDLGGTQQDSARVTGRFDIDTGVGTIVAVAGWRRVTVRQPDSDFDGSAFSAVSNPSGAPPTLAPQIYTLDDRDTSRQGELRFLTHDNGGSLKVLLGVGHFEETLRYRDAYLPVREFAAVLKTLGLYGTFEHQADQKTASWAGFGELIWAPVETVEVTADMRYTRDHKDTDSAQTATGLYSSAAALPDFSLDAGKTFDKWSPGITLAYKPDPGLTLFGKYVQGFRAGGFNALANNPDLLPYDSEEAENYEVGGKTLLFDRRLELGASVFYLRIDNALLPQLDPGSQDLFPLQNIGVAKTKGLEIDISAGVGAGLSLSASAGAYHYGFSNGPPGYDKRAFAPDYTASAAVDYQRPLTAALTAIARLSFRHRSGGKVPEGEPTGKDVDLGAYNLLDAQLGFRFLEVEFAAFVRNALDDHYVISNWGLGFNSSFIPGTYEGSTRAIVRDRGSVYGMRMSIAF